MTLTSRFVLPALVACALFSSTVDLFAATHPKRQIFGAIAYEPTRHQVGYSYDFKSSREARTEALKQCGEPNCEVVLTIRNGCGALARASGKPYAASGATRAEAETKAARLCGNKACTIVGWACTK